MAPVLPRYQQHLPFLYPPSRVVVPAPLQGPKSVTPKIVLSLFAGTFIIFVGAVLFWKLGKFFRRFSRKKVIGKGNAPSTRYAKTWYGWVPLQRRKTRRPVVKQCMSKARHWTAWDSTRNHYSRLWWESSSGELKICTANRMRRHKLPKYCSTRVATVDSSWDPCCCNVVHSNSHGHTGFPPTMTGVLEINDTFGGDAEGHMCPKGRHIIHSSASDLFRDDVELVASDNMQLNSWPTINYRGPGTGKHAARRIAHKRALSFDRSAYYSFSGELRPDLPSNNPPLWAHSSLPCLSELRRQRRLDESRYAWEPEQDERMPKSLRALRRSRKYQIWSARMALQASGSPSRTRLRWPVPPGSPKSEMLASLSSLPSSLAKLLSGKTSTVIRASILRSNTVMSSDKGRHKRRRNGVGYRIKGVGIDEWQPVSAPDIRGSPQIKATHSMLESDHIHAQKGSPQSELNEKEERLQERQGTKRNRQSHAVVPMRDLSDWEIMMIDGLDRKLGWLSSQLLPGRRPFHFAMLPNHWLNTRTWIVYDPASRAPLDVKRRLGDPRFNKPYPKPDLGRKRRCPKVNPKIAHTPHINSWREAVNKNRKASGLKDLVKPVDLFDGSAEDPPGGQFDPACWMLRKPPQAFSLSSRQKETYYEGGAGWQEKLIDWQNVRRGYRVRKLIHEGRANRTRTKEVALSVTRCTNARMHDMP